MSKTDYVELLLLQIRGAGLPPPELEHRFHDTRRWRFDACWPASMLAVDYQGGIFYTVTGDTSGHRTTKGMTNDQEKLNEAVCAGWRVLLVNAETVRNGQALVWIEQCLWGER